MMKKYEKTKENFIIQRRVGAGKVADVNKYIEEFIRKYDNVDEESIEYDIYSNLDGKDIVLIIQISFSYREDSNKITFGRKKSEHKEAGF